MQKTINIQQSSKVFHNHCGYRMKHFLSIFVQVLANEVGEGITVQSLLNTQSGWRGRHQQILALQKKVNCRNNLLQYLMQCKEGIFNFYHVCFLASFGAPKLMLLLYHGRTIGTSLGKFGMGVRLDNI